MIFEYCPSECKTILVITVPVSTADNCIKQVCDIKMMSYTNGVKTPLSCRINEVIIPLFLSFPVSCMRTLTVLFYFIFLSSFSPREQFYMGLCDSQTQCDWSTKAWRFMPRGPWSGPWGWTQVTNHSNDLAPASRHNTGHSKHNPLK